jgi:ubiquinone/menaquinone biosynthesis C-methylase UbiE
MVKKINDVVKYYDKVSEVYDSQYSSSYWELYNEITWNNIKRFLPKKKNSLILDAGGGTGIWAIKLAKLGYNVVLTDISEGMLNIAKEKINRLKLQKKITIKKVDIRNMSCFPNEYFDLAIAEGDPVSYCLKPERAVRELSRVVKKGSIVIISVDSKFVIIPKLIEQKRFKELEKFLKTGILKQEFKFQAFTLEELCNLFEKFGLKVVRIIGKPVLLSLIPKERREKLLQDKKVFNKILKLELKYCDEKSIVGFGGHLEIVGKKVR